MNLAQLAVELTLDFLRNVAASLNMLNFSRFEKARSCSPHEAKRNAGFWGAMQPCGER